MRYSLLENVKTTFFVEKNPFGTSHSLQLFYILYPYRYTRNIFEAPSIFRKFPVRVLVAGIEKNSPAVSRPGPRLRG